VFFNRRMIEPFYMFALRRFVPVVIPGLCVFVGYLLSRCQNATPRVLRAAGPAALAVIVAWPWLQYSAPVTTTDFRGLRAYCADWNDELNARGRPLVITDDHWIGAPLNYIGGQRVLVLYEASADTWEGLSAWLADLAQRGTPCCYLTRRALPENTGLRFERLAEKQFTSERLAHRSKPFPRRTIPRGARHRLFAMVP